MKTLLSTAVVIGAISALAVGGWLLLGSSGDRCKNMSGEEAAAYVMSNIADGFAHKTDEQVGGHRSIDELAIVGVTRDERVAGDDYHKVSLASKRDGRRIGDVDVYKDCTLGWFVPNR